MKNKEILNSQGLFLSGPDLKEDVLRLKSELNRELMFVAKTVWARLMPESALNLDQMGKADAHAKNISEYLSFIHQLEEKNKVTKACYEIFPSLPKVLGLASHPLIEKIVKQAGINNSQVGTIPVVRIDRPHEDFRLTPWHRDYWFSFLSENSIVIWFPLGEVDQQMGLLKVIPGSHKIENIPFRERDSSEPYEPIEDYDKHPGAIDVNCGIDQMLIFSQKLLHKSGVNRSQKIRVSIQLRFNDISDIASMTSSFGVSTSQYSKEAQIKALKNS